MIIFALIFLVVMLIALFIASFATSTRIGRCLSASRMSVGTWLNNLNPPTRQEVWAAIRPGIMIIAILAGCMLFVWLLLFITIVAICTAMGSFWSGLWIGLLVITAALLFIFKKIPGFRTPSTIGFYAAMLLLIILSGNFIFGWWSPGVMDSWARLNGNLKQELADKMDSWSTENEGKSGKIGRIDMNGVIGYSQDGKTRMPIPKGKKVRLATEYEGVKITPASVGTVWVMIENSDGDLIAGTVCLVVRDRINWDWERTDAEAKAKAETERVAKLAAIAVPPPQMQAAPQPPPAQIEVAQVNLTKIEVEFQGEKTTSRIELDRFDSKNIKFVQIWGDGHRVYFDGQRSANLIKGFYRHMVNGKMEEYNFILDPQNMRGECEQPGNKYASFRLM